MYEEKTNIFRKYFRFQWTKLTELFMENLTFNRKQFGGPNQFIMLPETRKTYSCIFWAGKKLNFEALPGLQGPNLGPEWGKGAGVPNGQKG